MSELKKVEPQELATVQLSPIEIMQQAKAAGLEVAEMKEMLALQKDWEANEARKAFHEALAEFKKNPPQVVKDKLNTQYNSNYTSIGNMVNTVNEAIGEYGLNARWEFPTAEGNDISCTCILAHRLGHEEKVTLTGPLDDSGKKNPLQQRKSARTYLKLETFEAVTGMASVEGNVDDDANSTGSQPETITQDQSANIEALLTEHGIDIEQFKKFLKVKRLDELLAGNYDAAIRAINERVKK